jgi:glycosyltransferase involved in cell wall biosynthesis
MAKIAMVLARSPGAPMTGRKAVIRTAIGALAAHGHEVDLIVLARRDAAFRHHGKVLWLGTPGKPRVLFNAARALLGGTDSLNEALFRSGRLLSSLRPLRGAYDFAVADTIRCAPYASALGVPWHLDMDDLFSARYEKFAAQAGELSAELVLGYYRDSAPGLAAVLPRGLMSRLLRIEAARIRQRELYWARQATTVSLVSPDEARRFAEDAGRPVHALPMSVTLGESRWQAREAAAAPVFVGALDYKPNLDSLAYYQREVFPALKAAGGTPVLHHIGNAPPPLRRLFSAQVVRFEGYVADLAARLRAAAFFVAPIVSGTGIKTKVLEAMAAGVPVVTTPEGVSGLQVEHRRHCFVCERPGEFPLAVRALADRELATELSENARRYVAENFSPEVLRRKWSAVVSELAR